VPEKDEIGPSLGSFDHSGKAFAFEHKTG